MRYWAIGLVVAGLLLILRLHLVGVLLAGLLVHELVHALAPRIAFGRIGRGGSRLLTVGLIAALVVGALVAAVLLAIGYLRSEVAGPGSLLVRLADILDASRGSLPGWIRDQLPGDPEALRVAMVDWMREHAREVQQVGRSVGLGLGHIAFGMVIGAMVCLREARGAERSTPLIEQLEARLVVLARAFRGIVFAQMKISAVNTVLTAVYLGIVLPLMGIHLPLTKTMVAATFVAGLLPIIGNLISNTLIVIVSLSWSFDTAAASLVFLVLLHKLEYFLNARIVGREIKSSAWELICAMLLAEAVFGIAGLIAAPILYAYVKDELKTVGLV